MTEIKNDIALAGTDDLLSRIALGTAFFRLQNYDEDISILEYYLSRGGNLIDSARVYGESEDVIGRWIADGGNADRFTLITKGCHGSDGRIPSDSYEATLESELAASLEKLGIGSVDVYMLHRDNPEIPVPRIMTALSQVVESGKAKYLGCSNWEYDRVSEADDCCAMEVLPSFTMVSNNLSLAKPAEPFYPGLVSVDDNGKAWHRRTGRPLISWSSQARGFFALPFSADTVADDPFSKRMMQVYGTYDNLERKKRAEKLGREKGGFTATQIALAWVVSQDFPVAAVVGPRSVKELESCIDAAAIRLTPEELDWLDLKDLQSF